MHTFLWHDYETFGKNIRTARPAQFAAIRTDANMNEISELLEREFVGRSLRSTQPTKFIVL
ncbi:MAG: hypothetical protein WAO71_04765 [Gallionella sp.]